MNRSERRRIQRDLGKNAIDTSQKLLQRALQSFYEAMRDNRIGEERAEKILNEAVDRMVE